MKSNNITAVIGIKNEAHRLPLIFKNLEDFAEIIVCDGGSTDDSEEICKKYEIRFIVRPPELRNTVAGDIIFLFEQVKTPYLLYVNCSHYYPQKLLEEFKKIAQEGKYHAVYHDNLIYSFAAVVHRPFIRRRSSASNFFRKDSVKFENAVIHNQSPVELPENLKWKVPAKDEYAVHIFRDYDIKKSEINHGYYADIDARQRFGAGIRTNIFFIFWKPLKYFLHQYLRCGSILYGAKGLIYALIYAQLEFNIQLRLWEQQSNITLDRTIEAHLKIREQLTKNKF
jgi:glycosyltransferase involved in cell wall biosynthesis